MHLCNSKSIGVGAAEIHFFELRPRGAAIYMGACGDHGTHLTNLFQMGGQRPASAARAGPELEANHSQSAHSELSPGAVGVMWLWPHPFMVWEDEGGTDSGIHPHMGPAAVLL